MAAELHQPRLGRAIVKRTLAFRRVVKPGVRRHHAIHGCDIDHARFAASGHTLFQRGQSGAHRLESGSNAAGIGAGEILRRQVGKRLYRHGDSVVYKNIEAGEAGEKIPQGRRVAGVESGTLHRKPEGLKFPLIIRQRRIVATIDDDMGARAGQRPCHGSPKMAARRRNKGGAAVEAKKLLGIHGASALSSSPGAGALNRRRNLTLHGKQAVTARLHCITLQCSKSRFTVPLVKLTLATLKLQKKSIRRSSGALSARQATPLYQKEFVQ